jgi:hypothetical protein
MYINPSVSASKLRLGSVFEGGACNDAGPRYEVPVRTSYILP